MSESLELDIVTVPIRDDVMVNDTLRGCDSREIESLVFVEQRS